VRSAFAELYARQLGCPVPVASAATVFRNDHILPETAEALVARGVPPKWTRAFRPKHVSECLAGLDGRILVLAMARMHLEALCGTPDLLGRAFLLAEVLGEPEEIADPVLDGADFELTFRRIALCVEALIERLGH